MSCYAHRLAPCDLGDPDWGDPWFPHGAFVASLAFWYGLVVWMFFLLFSLPYHVETIQCYHLLHELAHELAPVTPWFGGFVLCWCFLFALFWWVCFWLVFGFFGGDFITALWPVTVHFCWPLNQRTAMCMR